MIIKANVFLILRMAVSVSILGHGLVRLSKLSDFSAWIVDSFKGSMLPHEVVVPFIYLLPVAEFIIGLLLILGLFTKQAAIAGAIEMIILIFGSCLTENWDFLPSQLVHTAFFAVLLQLITVNTFALDRLINNQHK